MTEKFNLLLKLVFPNRNPTKEQIKKLILKVSDLFTFSEAKRDRDYLKDSELLRGYLLYFTPVNLSKLLSLFLELARHQVFFRNKDLKVIDIGSGLAPSVIAIFELIERGKIYLEHIRYVGIERQQSLLEPAISLIERFKPKGLDLKYDFFIDDCSKRESYLKIKDLKPDLVIYSNSLGEILEEGNLRVDDFPELIKPLTYKNPDFTLIIVEPATKRASMRLHRVRDRLIETVRLYPYSPCPNALPCAALKAKNWCYEERKWKAPEYLNFLKSVGLQTNFLKFSYIVMRKDGINICDSFSEDKHIFKNTSHLLNEKGKSRLWACSRGNLVEVEKLKRDFCDDEPMLKIKKGAYFRIDKFTEISPKKIRILKDSEIRVLYCPLSESL